jgi:hypothetical protein
MTRLKKPHMKTRTKKLVRSFGVKEGSTVSEPIFRLTMGFELFQEPCPSAVQANLDHIQAQSEDVGNLVCG